MKSWSKTLEKTVQHFCTSAEYAKDTAVTFLKNVDWKKVAIGVGAAVAIAGVTVLTGGSAVPVLIGAAVGAGSGAVINGGMAALQGGSVEDIAKAASDGFMWGGIGGAFGGSSGQFLAKAATSGSKVMSNPIVQKGLEGAVDTTLETVESAARGEEVNLMTIATSFAINTAVAGDSGNTTKTVNQLMDGADDVADDLTDEVKDNLAERIEQEVRKKDPVYKGSRPTEGQGFSSNGYNPKPGERTLEGYVKQKANPEVSLYTKSEGFNNHDGNVGGEFKRFGAESHGGVSPHVHQPVRNVTPNGDIYGNVGRKTGNGGVTSPGNKDVKQLYEYLENGKYHE